MQNRELFIYYAFKLALRLQPQRPEHQRPDSWEGKPIPVNVNTGVLVVTKDNVDPMLANTPK